MARKAAPTGTDKVLEYLKSAGQKGIIDLDSMWKNIQMNNRKQALEKHPYAVFQGKDGYWRTHLPDESKQDGRRLIKRRHREDLEDVLVNFYVSGTTDLAPTMRKLYPEWIRFYYLKSSSGLTAARLEGAWKRWYVGDKIIDRPIAKLTKNDIESWLLALIKDNNMNRRQYLNASKPMRQMMAWAVDEGVIEKNLADGIKLNPKVFKPDKKPDSKTQVFTDHEAKAIIEIALAEWREDEEVGAALAVAFCFFVGVRPGEICTFKKSDLKGNVITVKRAEQARYKMLPDGHIAFDRLDGEGKPKTHAAFRDVYVPREGMEILNFAIGSGSGISSKDDFYIFRNKGKRCNTTMITYRLEKYCKKLGIPRRSPNKIRKTYISRMIDSNVNINSLREQVGHTEEKTTYRNYCFDRRTPTERNQAFEAAFQNEWQEGRYAKATIQEG